MNTVREIQRINRLEAEKGITGDGSWHYQFKDSAWVYVGGLPLQMTEGDVLCMFSQVGEIEKLDMRRDNETGKFRGFCFIKFADQRSTILAVDNFTGVTFMDRIIKVDHKFYTPPKKRKREDLDSSEEDEEDRKLEDKKALQDVRWENTDYRDRANLEPKRKKQKLSKEEKKIKKKERIAKKERKKERKEKKLKQLEEEELKHHSSDTNVLPTPKKDSPNRHHSSSRGEYSRNSDGDRAYRREDYSRDYNSSRSSHHRDRDHKDNRRY